MIKAGYQDPIIKDGDEHFGDGRLGDVAQNPSGDWTTYLPTDTDQLQNEMGYETDSCVSQSILHVIETLARQQFSDTSEYSVRFLATVTGTGQKGGNDAGTVASALESGGCVLESDWPFQAATYQDFYTQPPQNLIKLAKAQFVDYSVGSSWLVNPTPAMMLSALRFSPLSLGVFAWPEPDANGIYQNVPGAQPCHQIEVYNAVPNEYWLIWDSYLQQSKKLAWDYQFFTGKRFTLNKTIATTPNPNGWLNMTVFIQFVRNLLGL